MLKMHCKPDCLEAGVDEVGRGALCGPVVAAAVVWGDEDALDIRDSKLLSPVRRKELAEYIKENAIDWSVSFIDNTVIDEKNILEATYDAMHHALDQLLIPIEHILVDGNAFRPYPGVSHTSVVKGDNTYVSIAAASILAKVARDAHMAEMVASYPAYGWAKNSGYGTAQHFAALKEHGLTPLHRKSFLKN